MVSVYGIRDIALNWFKAYLLNRKQHVVFNGANFNVRNISCGILKGSVLGQFSLTLYINEITNRERHTDI